MDGGLLGTHLGELEVLPHLPPSNNCSKELLIHFGSSVLDQGAAVGGGRYQVSHNRTGGCKGIRADSSMGGLSPASSIYACVRVGGCGCGWVCVWVGGWVGGWVWFPGTAPGMIAHLTIRYGPCIHPDSIPPRALHSVE